MIPQFDISEDKAFDGNGLRFSFKYLHSVTPELALWDVFRQKEFVDVITYTGWHDVRLMKASMSNDDISTMIRHGFTTVNATSIGNAAFLLLNCPSLIVRNHCAKFLYEYRKYHYSRLIT